MVFLNLTFDKFVKFRLTQYTKQLTNIHNISTVYYAPFFHILSNPISIQSIRTSHICHLKNGILTFLIDNQI